MYVGTVFMGGSHPAANGGAWMTAVFGFAGVQADDTRLAINPRLCAKWKTLQFNLAYKGDGFRIRISKSSVTITAPPTNARRHTVLVAGRKVACAPGAAVTVKYRPAKH